MPAPVLTCIDYPMPTDGTCVQQVWVEPAPALPTMSIADAQEIGLWIALLWATAWGIRMCKRALEGIG